MGWSPLSTTQAQALAGATVATPPWAVGLGDLVVVVADADQPGTSNQLDVSDSLGNAWTRLALDEQPLSLVGTCFSAVITEPGDTVLQARLWHDSGMITLIAARYRWDGPGSIALDGCVMSHGAGRNITSLPLTTTGASDLLVSVLDYGGVTSLTPTWHAEALAALPGSIPAALADLLDQPPATYRASWVTVGTATWICTVAAFKVLPPAALGTTGLRLMSHTLVPRVIDGAVRWVTYNLDLPLVDASTGGPWAGAAPVVLLRKQGGAWYAPDPSQITALAPDWYRLALTGDDLITPGWVFAVATATGAVAAYAVAWGGPDPGPPAGLDPPYWSIPLRLAGAGGVPLLGATPSVQICPEGGTFGAPVGPVHEVGHGYYEVLPTAADGATPGRLAIRAEATGAGLYQDEMVLVDPAAALTSAPGLRPHLTDPDAATLVEGGPLPPAVTGSGTSFHLQSWTKGAHRAQAAYRAGDTLTAEVRPAKSALALFAPAVGWYQGAGDDESGYEQGQTTVDYDSDDGARLEPGVVYTVLVWRAPEGDPANRELIVRLKLAVEPQPYPA